MIFKYNFEYTGDVQTWVVPYTGNYKLEVWGAAGGPGTLTSTTSKGGYVSAIYAAKVNEILYIYIGGKGSLITGGFNGGGNGGYDNYGGAEIGGGGGGATDIRVGGKDLINRIIVAGGGGGNGGWYNKFGSDGGSTNSRNALLGIGTNGITANSGGGGGGGGYYGGTGGYGVNDSYWVGTGGKGGSSFYIETLKYGTTTPGVNPDHGKAVISYRTRNIIVLYKDGKYYMPNKNTFNIYTKSFRDVTIKEIISIIDDYNYNYDISTLDFSFTLNEEKFYPKDIINFSEYKLCVITDDKPIKVNINYTPSYKALSNTTLKIKDKYIPLEENTLNRYLNIKAINESKITYNLNYDHRNNVTDRISSLIDTEVLKDNFYLSFKFNAPSARLSSLTLYENKDISYEKIWDDNLKISNDYKNTFVTFKKAFNKILVNKITKQYFKYYQNTLDKF